MKINTIETSHSKKITGNINNKSVKQHLLIKITLIFKWTNVLAYADITR